jgi:peptidoglycan/xylan/chitin deacetylase (PgdA/CDA1 family)
LLRALAALAITIASAAAVFAPIGLRATQPPATVARAMTLTFDDLPYVAFAQPNPLTAARRATADILRVLTAHHAPAVGFVNEGKLAVAGEESARIALLQQWIEAGATLGNHTYSHRDFNRLTVRQFEDEIVKGEVVTRRLMQPRQPAALYFRHPMTHTGDTREKKEAIDAFLAARGYTIAPHTIETSDFIFNVGYARAKRNGDTATEARLRDGYIQFALAATAFAEHASTAILGREVPQTLLVHVNDITADTLHDLLARLEERGYVFVSLDAAMTDLAYRIKDTTVSRTGPTWLWRWMRSQGKSVSFRDDPEPAAWVLDLYRAGLATR